MPANVRFAGIVQSLCRHGTLRSADSVPSLCRHGECVITQSPNATVFVNRLVACPRGATRNQVSSLCRHMLTKLSSQRARSLRLGRLPTSAHQGGSKYGRSADVRVGGQQHGQRATTLRLVACRRPIIGRITLSIALPTSMLGANSIASAPRRCVLVVCRRCC